jgi:hypothetical protein
VGLIDFPVRGDPGCEQDRRGAWIGMLKAIDLETDPVFMGPESVPRG